MAVSYTWKITGLKTSSVGNTNNVVTHVYWEKVGTEGLLEAKFLGSTPFDVTNLPEKFKFKPFSKLTEEEVIQWIKGIVTGDYEDHVNREIERQLNGLKVTVVNAELPWVNTE